jgi:hypothetical protein
MRRTKRSLQYSQRPFVKGPGNTVLSSGAMKVGKVAKRTRDIRVIWAKRILPNGQSTPIERFCIVFGGIEMSSCVMVPSEVVQRIRNSGVL